METRVAITSDQPHRRPPRATAVARPPRATSAPDVSPGGRGRGSTRATGDRRHRCRMSMRSTRWSVPDDATQIQTSTTRVATKATPRDIWRDTEALPSGGVDRRPPRVTSGAIPRRCRRVASTGGRRRPAAGHAGARPHRPPGHDRSPSTDVLKPSDHVPAVRQRRSQALASDSCQAGATPRRRGSRRLPRRSCCWRPQRRAAHRWRGRCRPRPRRCRRRSNRPC